MSEYPDTPSRAEHLAALEDLAVLASAGADARTTYDRVAERYDHFRELWIQWVGGEAEQAMLDDLAATLSPGARVLDAGAGTGAMARRILALQPDVKIGCGAARVTVRRPPSALSRATASSVVTVSCRRSTRARAAGSSGGAQPRSSIVSSWMRRAAIQARCEG